MDRFAAKVAAFGALLMTLSLSACGKQNSASTSTKVINVALLPIGKLEKKVLDTATKSIKQTYGVEVTLLHASAPPKIAYYKPRGRYRADIILDWINETQPKRFQKVIAITNYDVSTTNGKIYDWGVFGLGQVGGKACVVSTFRLRAGNVSEQKFLWRFSQTIAHEFGHTLGLPHCPNPLCLMADAKGTIKTVDAAKNELCKQCKQKISLR